LKLELGAVRAQELGQYKRKIGNVSASYFKAG